MISVSISVCIMCALFCLYCNAQLHTHSLNYTNTHIDTHPHAAHSVSRWLYNTWPHVPLSTTGVDVWRQLRVGAVLTGGTHLQRTSSGWPGQGQGQPQAAFLPCGQLLLQPHALEKTTTPHHQQSIIRSSVHQLSCWCKLDPACISYPAGASQIQCISCLAGTT